VTIIPRGRSLGSTMFIPKKDLLTHAMKRMLNQIAMGLGHLFAARIECPGTAQQQARRKYARATGAAYLETGIPRRI
jgi:ATP-dependent Zn protease